MKKNFFLLTFFACLFFSATNAQEKFSKVKFYPPASPEQRNELLGTLEVDHFYAEGDGIICEISSQALKHLKKTGVRFEVLIDDVAEHFRKNNSSRDFYAGEHADEQNRMIFESPCLAANSIIKTPVAFTAGSMGGYYTLAEMNTKMDALVAAYPTIVSKFSIGNSYQGRPIWCIKISDNVATDEVGEPEVLYQGLQHAREAIGGTSLIFFMQYLAENYGSDTRVTDLVNTRELFIIPCLNPDGYEYNRTTNPSGGGLWRKNRRPNSGGSFGVDLNRNWSVDWANCAGASSACGSSSQSNDTYWGTAPFSEPETNALKAFITSHHFVLGIDQHCYGPYYSLPFGRPNLHTLSAVDQNFYNYTAALMGKYNCQRAGNSPQTVGYEVAGGMKDWMLLGDIGVGTKGKIYGLTGEAGGGGFWAPSSSIIPLSKGLCFQNLQAAYVAGSYFDIQDQNDLAVTTITGNFKGLLRRVGVINDPVTISLVPIENILNAGSPVTISSFANYNDTYTASFSYTLSPSITNGQRIRFAWEIETGGYSYYDTVTKFYNPTTLLFDNMEGTFSTNWTATISPSSTNGWNFTTNGAYEGVRSLAESPVGNYTASSTRRVTYKNAINLSNATAAYLSFWVKHRTENCNDKLRMQISRDGGNTYTTVCGINTISENDGTLAGLPALTGIRENWTRELVNLSAFKGLSNVRFRFEFTSNADASGDTYYKKTDDGFYIDNLRIIKTTAALSGRSAPVITLNGELIENRDGYLNWEAVTDSEEDYFVVEKSTNGQTFETIGNVKGYPPYQYTDEELTEGNNVYRVKHIRTNATPIYSGQVTLMKKSGALNMVVYPNPVNDQLNVQLNNFKAQTIIMQVTDVFGRTMFTKSVNLKTGNSSVSIDTDKWGRQVYILRVTNAKNEVLSLQKFVKQ
jgi:carboxypeptidase T